MWRGMHSVSEARRISGEGRVWDARDALESAGLVVGCNRPVRSCISWWEFRVCIVLRPVSCNFYVRPVEDCAPGRRTRPG